MQQRIDSPRAACSGRTVFSGSALEQYGVCVRAGAG